MANPSKPIVTSDALKFRWGSYAEAASKTLDTEDIYFLYAPDSADATYGVIKVNGVTFGSRVVDIAMDAAAGVDSSMIVKRITDTGTISETKLAMVSVEEHQHITNVVNTVENIIDDASLLKNINVNGVEGDVEGNIASVTINGDKILVGGNGAYKDSSIDAAIAQIDASLQQAISAAGVTSFGGATGAITVKGGSATNGDVNLSMNGQQLQAAVVGLGTAAYEASTAFDPAGAADAVLGTDGDASTVNTVYGVKAYAAALAKDASTIAEHTEHGASNGIDVSVTTENGSVKSVTVNAPDFDSLYDASGAAAQALADAKDAMDASFGALEVTDAQATGSGYVTAVTQSNGKIAVTKTVLPDGTFKVKVGGVDKVTFTDNADADASIDFVGGHNITVTEANGVITIAADAATTPNDGKLTITGNGTTAREFTANQTADAALDISAGSYATVEATTGKITVGVNGTNAVTENSTALVESGAVYTAIEQAKVDTGLTIEKQSSADTGYFATYILKNTSTGAQVGDKINIPKDYLVKSATLETVTVADEPYAGAQVGDKYIDFEIRSWDASTSTGVDHLYLPVNDLVDVYTGGNGITVDNNRVISASVNAANGLSVDATGISMALSSSTAAGAMSAADKAKLDGITDASFNAWNAAQPNKIETIHVNGQAATIDNATKDASVTINATQIKIGGADSSTVAEKIAEAISAAGVTSFGGATGAISVDNTATTTAGHVTFTMNNNQLTAVADNVAPANVVSGIAAHTEHGASNGIDVSVTTTAGQVSAVTVNAPDFANTYVTKTAFDASIDNINSSIDNLQAKDIEIDSSISALKAKDIEIDSSISALKAKDIEIDSSITAIKEQLMWHTLE